MLLESPLVVCTWYEQWIEEDWLAGLAQTLLFKYHRQISLSDDWRAEGWQFLKKRFGHGGGARTSIISPNINRKSVHHPDWLFGVFYLTPQLRSSSDHWVFIFLITGTGQDSKAGSTSSIPTGTVKGSHPTPVSSPWRAGSRPWWQELRNNTSVIMWVAGKPRWNPKTMAGGISVQQTTVLYIIEIHCYRWPPPPRQ